MAALTCRSFYSLLRGAVSVPRWVETAAELGYGAVALADVNSLAGAVDLYDVRPILGVEILTQNQRVILLAENERGYRNLCRITTARHLDPAFDLVEQIEADGRGLICICPQAELLGQLQAVFRKDCLFAGCRNAQEAQRAAAGGAEPVAWTGANWLEDDDVTVARLLARLLARIRRLSVAGAGPEDRDGFATLVSARRMERLLRRCPAALANADRLVERCELELLTGQPILPCVELPRGTTGDRELARLCHRGLARKYNPVSKEVVKRLEHELATIRV